MHMYVLSMNTENQHPYHNSNTKHTTLRVRVSFCKVQTTKKKIQEEKRPSRALRVKCEAINQ